MKHTLQITALVWEPLARPARPEAQRDATRVLGTRQEGGCGRRRSGPRVRFTDRHGNGVRVRRRRLEFAERVPTRLPFDHSGCVLNITRFDPSALSFVPILRFFPPPPPPIFHILDPQARLLGPRGGRSQPRRLVHIGRKDGGVPGEAEPTNTEQHLPVNPA